MGLTAGCAVCHDHKFDPISTKRLLDVFVLPQVLADPALDGNKLDTPPVIKVPPWISGQAGRAGEKAGRP